MNGFRVIGLKGNGTAIDFPVPDGKWELSEKFDEESRVEGDVVLLMEVVDEESGEYRILREWVFNDGKWVEALGRVEG